MKNQALVSAKLHNLVIHHLIALLYLFGLLFISPLHTSWPLGVALIVWVWDLHYRSIRVRYVHVCLDKMCCYMFDS